MTRARDLANFVSNAQGDVRFDTDTLFIDSSANSIGIGNTAPSRPLHITANPAMIMLEDSDGGSNDKKAQIQVDTGAFEINARNDDDSSRTDNILVADLGTGNIGIGGSPKPYLSAYKALDINTGRSSIMSSTGTPQTWMMTNSYYDSTNSRNEYSVSSHAASYYLQQTGAHFFATAPSGTADAAITFTEKVRIDSDGLKFNGDTAAANALDDYEEGTWTPTLLEGGSISNNYSSYVKIGSLVYAYAYVQVSSVPNNTGSFRIGGLPYNSTNNSSYFAGGSLSYVGSNNAQYWSDPLVYYGNNFIYFHRLDSNGASIKNNNVQGTWPIILTVTYHTH